MDKFAQVALHSGGLNREGRCGFPVLTASLAALLFIATVATFWSACNNGFVEWDDPAYVTQVPEVTNGLTLRGICWSLTTPIVCNWHPVTMISLQLDAQLFGTGPLGFHRTAVLIHAVNAILCFLLLIALTGNLTGSFIVAALFALHPMRVESVAWISERKDLLSGFFFFLTLLAYIRYVSKQSIARYLLVATLLALGLASKSMLVTTPAVLLLLDFWPLSRLDPGDPEKLQAVGRLLLEKLPLFGISAIVSLIALITQEEAMSPLKITTMSDRFANAVVSIIAYVAQTICPVRLSPMYPMQDVSTLRMVAAACLLAVLTLLAIRYRKRYPYLLTGWFWFVGMLVPVLGIVQVGSQSRADRYMYLPQIGLFIAAVWTLSDICSGLKRKAVLTVGVIGSFLLFCIVQTVDQITVWNNTETMWRTAYRLYPESDMIVRHLVLALYREEKHGEAIRLTEEILATTDERNTERMKMLAALEGKLGNNLASITILTRALRHSPLNHELYSTRGKANSISGNWDVAASDYQQALNLAPRAPAYSFYLAHALGKTGEHDQSRKLYRSAVERWPQWPRQAAFSSWELSTSLDPADRVDVWPVYLAEQATEARGENSAPYLDVLAAAYAHNRQFEKALETATRAAAIASQMQEHEYELQIRQRIRLYFEHQPFRESLQSRSSMKHRLEASQ